MSLEPKIACHYGYLGSSFFSVPMKNIKGIPGGLNQLPDECELVINTLYKEANLIFSFSSYGSYIGEVFFKSRVVFKVAGEKIKEYISEENQEMHILDGRFDPQTVFDHIEKAKDAVVTLDFKDKNSNKPMIEIASKIAREIEGKIQDQILENSQKAELKIQEWKKEKPWAWK